MMKKTQILESIQDMPDEFSIDELMERLLILQKIEEGQKQIESGQFFSEKEAKKRLDQWLK
jgi:predicted transcriptional regulator